MFANIKGNASIVSDGVSEANWMNGGYFAYNVPNANLTIYTLNGMYPFSKNTTDPETT